MDKHLKVLHVDAASAFYRVERFPVGPFWGSVDLGLHLVGREAGKQSVLNFGTPGNDDVLKDGVRIVASPGMDGQFGTTDDHDVYLFENTAADAGLSAPFNAWMTFFGQFFDHGLDLVTKGGSGTIYIPLQDKRPAGTAIIFPAEYKGKAFFLLMTTDRQLSVTSVQPMNTLHVPEAAKSAVYASFKGKALNQLPAAQGNTLEATITGAVKKAGTLVYVRLKNV